MALTVVKHTTPTMSTYFDDAVALLQDLIATPSVSREETAAADLMQRRMEEWGLNPQREMNNVWAVCPDYDASRPTLLLNAHLDTVKPVASWTRQPHVPTIEGDRLYGLGANDCGGGLVTLLMTYRRLLKAQPLKPSRAYNIVYLASAEEEVSGANGVARALPLLPPVSVAVVGEPTGLQPAIAEKGLMVVDGYADGVSGHAARNERLPFPAHQSASGTDEDDCHRGGERHAAQRRARPSALCTRCAHHRTLQQRGGICLLAVKDEEMSSGGSLIPSALVIHHHRASIGETLP